MSEASAHKMAYCVEPSPGTTPTNPRFQRLPDTRTSLNMTRETIPSNRLTGDRFPAEPRSGARGAGGDIPVDLSFETYDAFIASALQGVWSAPASLDSVDITIDSTPTPGQEEGDTYNTANGVVTFERVDAASEELVLLYVPTASPDAAETYEFTGTSGGAQTIDGETFEPTAFTNVAEESTCLAGDTRTAMSILREFSDLPDENFLLYTGCEVATWSLQAEANNVATSTFTMFGRTMEAPALTAPAGTSYAPAVDTEAFDTFSGEMKVDGVAQCIVTSYGLTVTNGHAPRYTVGCEGSGTPSVTQSVIEGTATIYFESPALYKKFFSEESFSLELTLQDSEGNQLIISLPNLKISSATPDVTGDGPITMPINFTAHKDNTLGSHISVTSKQAA